MQAIVLLNSSAGGFGRGNASDCASRVKAAMESAGIEAEIRSVRTDRLAEEARQAATAGVDAVIAGGGDGTISTVSGALVGTDTPLGVLPLGTLNHFAKDLRIPLALEEAAQTIARQSTLRIDVGSVNGQIFVNNSSLGVYPRAVLERDARRSYLGKWPAMLLAILKTFRRFPLLSTRIDAADRLQLRMTPLVFVGNNEYQLDRLNVGGRACLDRGCLALYVANTRSRWGMLRLTLRALLGKLRQDRDFESTCISECWIETRRRRLHVAVDGEVLTMRPPLHYKILPGALSVFAPSVEETNLPQEAMAVGGDFR